MESGKIVWRIGLGKYSPGIATDHYYYFSLNGMLMSFRGRNSPREAPAATDGDTDGKRKRGRPAKRGRPGA